MSHHASHHTRHGVGLQVRPARREDAQWLTDCALAMALETEHKQLDPLIVHAGICAGIAEPDKARYLVAETADRALIATLMLTSEWSDWRNGMWWWIQSVYVLPDQRRRGVFAALYAHVEALAQRTHGVIGLRLYVERDNAVAQRTYAALGMHDAGYAIYESML